MNRQTSHGDPHIKLTETVSMCRCMCVCVCICKIDVIELDCVNVFHTFFSLLLRRNASTCVLRLLLLHSVRFVEPPDSVC